MIETVLIVEDNKLLQELYTFFLIESGFLVKGIANNGEEAIRIFNAYSQKPDIILMDYKMPIMNGIDATKEILRISDSPPKIILISADKNIKKLGLSMGAIGFIEKPFEFRELGIIIRRICGTEEEI